jgi:hypothetical protein
VHRIKKLKIAQGPKDCIAIERNTYDRDCNDLSVVVFYENVFIEVQMLRYLKLSSHFSHKIQ